jgi:3-dehydroquinate synthase
MPDVAEVRLGSRSYPVIVGTAILDSAGDLLKKSVLQGRAAIVTDSNVGPLYAGRVQRSLQACGIETTVITVPAGEKSKSLPVAEQVCDELIAAGLDRSSFLVALGGGVIGDLAGFVAAIYYRGIPFVQIPTTIVAQVDSSVGGKTGVNARGGKNLIGSFHQPRAVIADVDTLRSLPPREYNEGFAEIIKHALIRDPALFGELPEKATADMPALIRRNVEIKARIVEADEHETTGERALLNFGHTIGHAIENAAEYGTFLHGEAISLGLLAACRLSERKAGLPSSIVQATLAKLRYYQLPVSLTDSIPTETIMAALLRDKKFAAGSIRFVLLRDVGDAFVSKDVTLEEIREAVGKLRG